MHNRLLYIPAWTKKRDKTQKQATSVVSRLPASRPARRLPTRLPDSRLSHSTPSSIIMTISLVRPSLQTHAPRQRGMYVPICTTCRHLATTICTLLVSGISANTCLICCLQARPVASRTRLHNQGLGSGWLQMGLVVTSRLAPHRFFVRPSLPC
jgi:hypothetical protein